MDMTGVALFRLANGKIVERWSSIDRESVSRHRNGALRCGIGEPF